VPLQCERRAASGEQRTTAVGRQEDPEDALADVITSYRNRNIRHANALEAAAVPTVSHKVVLRTVSSDYRALVDLLAIGGSGFLGREITRQAQLAGHRVIATFHASVPPATDVEWHKLDIRRRDDVIALALRARPDAVINAAYRQSDWETTADGGMHVALAAAAAGARLVHVSSDAVFSGAAPSYDETRQPDPVTPYGAAKAAAETAVKGVTPASIIARTSLIIGDGESKHERLVHALASGTVAGALFTDEVRCPVHVTDLAGALLELAAAPHAGVCHVAGADAISRYELGLLIAQRDGLDQAALPAGLRAATGIPGAHDVRLDTTRTQERLATRLRGAREFLAPTSP
jgi:dTDP-4-dehydrorhamnose reductase